MLAAGAMALLALAALWPEFNRWLARGPRDFEECMQHVQAEQLSDDERSAAMTACNASFAGRRKAGGGYSYYDFMQDRTFDIVGPNPTPEEAKRIDLEYAAFLRAQRRTLLPELPKMELKGILAGPERARRPVGPPIVLTSKNPAPAAAKRSITERAKTTKCDDGSLSCTWDRFSAGVRAAFASSGARP